MATEDCAACKPIATTTLDSESLITAQHADRWLSVVTEIIHLVILETLGQFNGHVGICRLVARHDDRNAWQLEIPGLAAQGRNG